MHAARRVQRSRTADGDQPVTDFEISFPLHFQSFPVPGIEILRPPMLPSNRRYADTTKIPRPFRLPALPTHRPTRPSPSSPWAPDVHLPHLRRRADDRHVCVTKSLVISATPSKKWTYLRTSNTLDFRILRHNSPSRRRLRRVPDSGRHAHQPHRKLLRARYPHRPRLPGLHEIGGIAQAAGIRAPAPVLSEHHVTLVAPELYAPPTASP